MSQLLNIIIIIVYQPVCIVLLTPLGRADLALTRLRVQMNTINNRAVFPHIMLEMDLNISIVLVGENTQKNYIDVR